MFIFDDAIEIRQLDFIVDHTSCVIFTILV